MSTDNSIPTVEETIKFAKEHGFKFKQYSVGDKTCGCAMTILVLMKHPEFFIVDDVDYWYEFRKIYGQHSPHELYGPFDDILLCPELEEQYRLDYKHPLSVFGIDLAKAVLKENMLEKEH